MRSVPCSPTAPPGPEHYLGLVLFAPLPRIWLSAPSYGANERCKWEKKGTRLQPASLVSIALKIFASPNHCVPLRFWWFVESPRPRFFRGLSCNRDLAICRGSIQVCITYLGLISRTESLVRITVERNRPGGKKRAQWIATCIAVAGEVYAYMQIGAVACGFSLPCNVLSSGGPWDWVSEHVRCGQPNLP